MHPSFPLLFLSRLSFFISLLRGKWCFREKERYNKKFWDIFETEEWSCCETWFIRISFLLKTREYSRKWTREFNSTKVNGWLTVKAQISDRSIDKCYFNLSIREGCYPISGINERKTDRILIEHLQTSFAGNRKTNLYEVGYFPSFHPSMRLI